MALRSEKPKKPSTSDELVRLVSDFGYEVPDPSEVAAYLDHHPGLGNVLAKTAKSVSDYFPAGTHTALFVSRDFESEADDALDPLFVVIRVPNLPSEKRTSILFDFEDRWRKEAAGKEAVAGQIVFDVA